MSRRNRSRGDFKSFLDSRAEEEYLARQKKDRELTERQKRARDGGEIEGYDSGMSSRRYNS